jgi:small subunit ribosomal protein S8
MRDLLSDLISRLKNASKMKHSVVPVPRSNLNVRLLSILQKEGYIMGYKFLSNDPYHLEVYLKYGDLGASFKDIKRISKSGKRTYISSKSLDSLRNGLGTYIISTSKGLVSDREAQALRLGGELLISIF